MIFINKEYSMSLRKWLLHPAPRYHLFIYSTKTASMLLPQVDSPSNAIVGVTRGCIEKLNRDELQGVIAHEFSHILNGDMRLNIRLIGILHGILLLGLLGYYLLRIGGRSRNSNNNGGIVLLALGLTVIGYGGTFFWQFD